MLDADSVPHHPREVGQDGDFKKGCAEDDGGDDGGEYDEVGDGLADANPGGAAGAGLKDLGLLREGFVLGLALGGAEAPGGAGDDACDGTDCEAPQPSTCSTSADCPSGEACLEVGICAPPTWCGCGTGDATCDGDDDDCDGTLDEDYALTSTTCGVGAC